MKRWINLFVAVIIIHFTDGQALTIKEGRLVVHQFEYSVCDALNQHCYNIPKENVNYIESNTGEF